MKQRRFVLLALALWPSLCALGDPATLHIGSGVAGPCPTGVGTGPCAGIIGGDVLVIPSDKFDVFQQANNSVGFNDLLLITAVPNTTVFLTPEILFATEFNPYTASNGTVLTFSSAADRGAMTNGQN